ncbi:MAG: sodium:solute symporter [Bacteroidia bacterium]|nr:sodium:solute symporter [Bacteroidia bacterium]
MDPFYVLLSIGIYFGILLFISWVTARKADSDAYFLGNHASPWLVVALGMIGDSLSGVTFISVPGKVGTGQFSYMQLVFGYFFGYMIITRVLLPLYYRMNLTSIYSYLRERFGVYSERTGSGLFILSRLLGAAARLYLAVGVLQLFVFQQLGVPFGLTVFLIIGLMLLYTYRGGIKTLVWTDMMQSGFLILGVVLSIIAISSQLNMGFTDMVNTVSGSSYSKTFFWDWKEKNFFFKEFLGGIFIAVAMTGLDQNMMQKNLSCRSLADAQKNIRLFSIILVVVNVFFLTLGALLWIYSEQIGIPIPEKTDHLFPSLALGPLGAMAGLAFILGLTAATFSSADSVLTTLTTAFYIDFLGLDKGGEQVNRKRRRIQIHFVFAILLGLVILLFHAFNQQAIIDTVLLVAAYTYGPMLGLFAFGIFTKRKVMDKAVPFICILSPVLTFILSFFSKQLFSGYQFGNELLIVNAGFTFAGLFFTSSPSQTNPSRL